MGESHQDLAHRVKLPVAVQDMKCYIFFRFYFGVGLLILLLSEVAPAQVPFSRGVNLPHWFQKPDARQIHFGTFSKKDFEDIKSLGCDVVRLPINLREMTNGAPDYTLDTLFLSFLDQVVDWAEALQIHLILDNHSFDPEKNTDPSVEDWLVKAWTQMAAHYAGRSEYLYYEVLNEPHGILDAVWNGIQQRVIDAIRSQDTSHFIVVGPANWNSYRHLDKMPAFADEKLIYTFHFYDPFVFTHQGANWVNPSMESLANVPFPYFAEGMPSTPASLEGTWVGNALKNYSAEGNPSRVKELIDFAADFKQRRGVRVYCGEFGVLMTNSPEQDRINWYALVRRYLEEKGIPWTIWDYTDGFGLFEKNTPQDFEHDLNVPLVQALGLNAPPQTDYIQTPLTKGFPLYTDAIAYEIYNGSNPGTGTLNFYSADQPIEGSYCLYWTGVGQYNPISFNFKRDLDLHLLKNYNHSLDFYVRGNSPSARFDVRFIDSDDGPADLPWRMGKTISNIPHDSAWHLIHIPLSSLEEKGAWEAGKYYPPDGKHFDWTSVDRFEIIPEHQALDGIEFMFDNIRVTGDDVIVSVADDEEASFISVYPNPVASEATIGYRLTKGGAVEISVYSLQGTRVKSLRRRHDGPAVELLAWDRTDDGGMRLPSGLYFVVIVSEKGTRSVKVRVE